MYKGVSNTNDQKSFLYRHSVIRWRILRGVYKRYPKFFIYPPPTENFIFVLINEATSDLAQSVDAKIATLGSSSPLNMFSFAILDHFAIQLLARPRLILK